MVTKGNYQRTRKGKEEEDTQLCLYRLNRLIPSLVLQLPLLQSFSQIFHAFVDFEAEPGENCKWNYNWNNLVLNEISNKTLFLSFTCYYHPEPRGVEDYVVFIFPQIIDNRIGSRQIKLETLKRILKTWKKS